jgi:hypothetical protein
LFTGGIERATATVSDDETKESEKGNHRKAASAKHHFAVVGVQNKTEERGAKNIIFYKAHNIAFGYKKEN